MTYRIVYCSRNRIAGSTQEVDAAIQALLLASRAKNEAAGITGALVFNGTAFAQVLEGPRDQVDIAFARIRFDPRHSNVLVLEQDHQPERSFENWTMAYSDIRSFHGLAEANLDLGAVHANPHGLAGKMLEYLRSVVNAHLSEEL